MKINIMDYDWNLATNLANEVLTKTRHSKIIDIIETLLICFLLPIFTIFCLTFVNTNNRAFNTVFLVFGSIFLYFIFLKIANKIERKNLEVMFKNEKNLGLMAMYDPYMLKKDKKYYLYFYPYHNDNRTKVKFEISQDNFYNYKNIIKIKKLNPKDKKELLVVETSTNLFEGKMEYTTSLKDITF